MKRRPFIKIIKEKTINGAILSSVFFLLAFSALLGAQEITGSGRTVRAEKEDIAVQAGLDPESPRLTDDVVMTVTADHSPEYSIESPIFGDRYGGFEVLDVSSVENAISGSRQTSRFRVRLRPSESGDLSLPPIPLTAVKSGSNAKVSLIIPPGKITVRSDYDKKKADLSDVQGPFGVIKKYAFPIAAGTVLLLMILLLFWLIVQRKKKLTEFVEPVILPFDKALAELNTLMEEKVYVRDVREFYLKITGIVRWFIEQTTGLRAPEQTTEEFLSTLARAKKKNSIFSDSMKDHLKKFLEFSDLVKFAKFRPTLDEIFDAYNNAKLVIETPLETGGGGDDSGTVLSSKANIRNEIDRQETVNENKTIDTDETVSVEGGKTYVTEAVLKENRFNKNICSDKRDKQSEENFYEPEKYIKENGGEK